jgi:hypothetical protein
MKDIFQFLNELREKCRSLTNEKDIFENGVIKVPIEDLDKLIGIVELKHKEIERLKADIEEALELLKRGGPGTRSQIQQLLEKALEGEE